jgi:hypothetical protein
VTRVCIVSASRQNVFFGELLDAVAGALTSAGLTVERALDHFPEPEPDLTYLFVPHEYTPLVLDTAQPTELHLRRTVALCTEQPGTQWFDLTAELAGRAGAVVDINPLGAAELRRRGIEARVLQLGYVAGWDCWHGDESVERPVDVTFMGGHTRRRAKAIARCGRALAGRRTELLLVESQVPHQADTAHYLSGDAKWRALAQAKLIVNVHRGELGYLEWQRVVEAIANGCVVVTEHSLGFEPLVPGEHFISATCDGLPAALEALLANPGEVARIRQAAYRFLVDELPITETIGPLVEALEIAAATPFEPGVGIRTVPAPRELQMPPTLAAKFMEANSDLDVLRMATKELLLGQRELSRQVAELSSPGRRRDRIERHGADPQIPRVSVVLTVHNYADVVGEAIESVADSDFEAHELVIVEDASTDGSLEAIRAALRRCPWVPATVIARGRNGGLPAARNLGVEHSRGEYVFILDADNTIYPHALRRLVDTLDENPEARFAYGIIETFGASGPNGLMSWLGWDPARLGWGNFVDAMALVRRSAILTVGGYTTDRRLYGWEDFALWCAFADRRWWGIRVPEILARYRTGHSMISITNIDAKAAWSALLERYEWLLGEPSAA